MCGDEGVRERVVQGRACSPKTLEARVPGRTGRNNVEGKLPGSPLLQVGVWSRGTPERDFSLIVFLYVLAFETELLRLGPMPTSR